MVSKSSFYALLLAGIFAAICGPDRAQVPAAAKVPAAARVKVWQGTFTLPTYQEGPPDPNPPFDAYQTTRFNYPYTLRTNLTGEKADHAWRAIFLENEYLKCTVLPDIGGHLYTCIDKVSGQSMFYANPSIKKAQIGYRGAWAAFGVEFNFPVSHNWVSMSPVDFAYASHEDGSASVWVGNIDRAYGMQWGVELVLKPGSTLLEERVTLYNRSDVRHRYYWWNNAGVQVWDDSRIDYPMRFIASHGYTDVYRWPIDAEGKDLSIIKNQTDGPVSYFVHGSHEPFMGIWSPHTQIRGRSLRRISGAAGEENLDVGRGSGGPGLAHGTIRQPQRVRRSAGRAVPQPGDVCVSRTRADHPIQRVLDAGSRNGRNFAREQGWSRSFRYAWRRGFGCIECE